MTCSRNRHGRLRASELLRQLVETAVARCMDEGLVSGQRVAVDASLIGTGSRDCANAFGAASNGSAPCGANDEFLLAATARTLRKRAKISPAPRQTGKQLDPRAFAPCKGCVFRDRNGVFVHRIGGRDHRMFPGQFKFIVHPHHRPGDRGPRRG